MLSTLVFCLVSLLASTSNAYLLKFFTEDYCSDGQVHSLEIKPGDECICAPEWNERVKSVQITHSFPEDSPLAIVAFFNSATCSKSFDEATAQGNAGCLGVGAGRDPFQSIGVIVEEPAVRKPGAKTGPVHGSIYEDQQGKVFRWRQIAEGAWSGVPIEKWDEEMVAGTEKLEFGKDYPFNFTEYYEEHGKPNDKKDL